MTAHARRPPTPRPQCGGDSGSDGVRRCPSHDAPLAFVTRGVRMLGEAAVPLNLVLVGHTLGRPPRGRALSWRTNLAILVARMLLMPAFATCLCVVLDRTLGVDGGLGWIQLPDPYDEVFFLAVVAVSATPTMNTLVLMTELAGGDGEAVATAIYTQYVASPLVLILSLTGAMVVLRVT
jgi:predicted permease